MRKFRAERTTRHSAARDTLHHAVTFAPRLSACLAACVTVAVAACAHFGAPTPTSGALSAVVGDWVDLASSSGSDTTLWHLSADGYRRITDLHNGHETRRGRDHWYTIAATSDSVDGVICFVKRLGRDGASCTDFRLEITTEQAMRPRVRLLAPWARRGLHERVLVPLHTHSLDR